MEGSWEALPPPAALFPPEGLPEGFVAGLDGTRPPPVEGFLPPEGLVEGLVAGFGRDVEGWLAEGRELPPLLEGRVACGRLPPVDGLLEEGREALLLPEGREVLRLLEGRE